MTKINRLSLRKNFSWNFVGSLVYSFSQFLILIIIAKIGSAQMVGLYSIGLAITAPIIMLTNLQLRQVQATDTTFYYNFNDYFGLRIITGLIMSIITLIIVYFSNYDNQKTIIILLVALMKIIDSYSDVVYGQLQQLERMDYIGKSRIFKGILTLLVMGISLVLTNDLILALLVLNMSWFAIFFFYDRKRIQLFSITVKPAFNFNKLKKLTVLTFPLGIVLMLGSLNTNLPRIIVENFHGEATLGYFTSIAYLLVAGNTFIQAVGQAVAPRMAKLYKNKSFNKFKRNIFLLIILGCSIGLLGTLIASLFGKLILRIIYDSTYMEYNNILIMVMIAGVFLFSSSFLGHGITSMRLFKVQPLIGIGGLIITSIFSFALIPSYGVQGAAYTLIVGAIAQFLIRLFVVIIHFRIIKHPK